MRLISVGDHIDEGAYVLHSRFSQAVNFVKAAQGQGHAPVFPLLTYVSPEVGAGPTNIVVSVLPPIAEKTCSFGRDGLVFGPQKYVVAASVRYQSSLRIAAVAGARYVERLSLLETELARQAASKSLVFLLGPDAPSAVTSGFEQALRQRCRASVRALLAGRVRVGVGLIKGVGFGLTPGGDDFLTGVLLGLWFRQQIDEHDYAPVRETIYNAALGNNVLSNTFLQCANAGWLFERWQQVMKFLAGDTMVSARRIVRAVLTFGETSGADAMTGLVFALRHAENLLRET